MRDCLLSGFFAVEPVAANETTCLYGSLAGFVYKEILKSLGKYYPVAVLILRVDSQQRTFFVLSFPAKNEKDNSGFSSVVYEPHDIEYFYQVM